MSQYRKEKACTTILILLYCYREKRYLSKIAEMEKLEIPQASDSKGSKTGRENVHPEGIWTQGV